MSNLIILPEGQSTRWVLRNYYQQPTGSAISEAQSIHNRQYFNTLFRHEEQWNRDFRADLFGNLYANNRKKYVQQLRNNGTYLNLTIYSELLGGGGNTDATITTHKPDGTLISTLSFEYSLQILSTLFQTTYTNVKVIDIGGKIGVYFTSSLVTNAYINEYIAYYGTIPDGIATTDILSLTATGNNAGSNLNNPCSFVYVDSLNVYAIKFDENYNSSGATTGTLSHVKNIDNTATLRAYILKSLLPQDQCFYMAINAYTDKSHTELICTLESELLTIKTDLPNTVKFEWYDLGRKVGLLEWNRTYEYKHELYLPCQFYSFSAALPNSEIYVDEEGRGRFLNADYERKYKVVFDEPLPRYIIETLKIAMMHRYFYVNGKRFVPDAKSFTAEKTDGGMLFIASFDMVEYAVTGVIDTTDYDLEHMVASPYEYLLIDTTNTLLIDDTHKLRIK